MSLRQLTKERLLKAAEFFEVEANEENTNAEIVTALEEKGVSWKNYKKFVEPLFDQSQPPLDAPLIQEYNEDEKLPTVEQADEQFNNVVLLKMDRKNARYDILGYTFTKEHPFRAMSENDAQQIIDTVEGFRLASPKEAKQYYG